MRRGKKKKNWYEKLIKFVENSFKLPIDPVIYIVHFSIKQKKTQWNHKFNLQKYDKYFSFNVIKYYIKFERLKILNKNVHKKISLMNRVFANVPGDTGSIPGWVIPKCQKMVLDATLLSIIK